ncbi:MAG: hopanoid biosynthesis associated protein HpnK, partial [Desulfobacterium sp.]|nr:hopanoid biosynthesis associated protein HpnK [Desulfobacterium sp.]
MLNLIVNADDFGISEKVNEGIYNAFTHGILTSTSIIANGRAFDHAVGIYKTIQDLDVGVHLTLLEEQPVADRNQIPTLLTSGGSFKKNATNFTKDYFLGKINLDEVLYEFEAQVLKIKNSGIPISHMDSHQHIHMLPGIFKIAVALARKHNIPAIRIPYERPRWYMLKKSGMFTRFLQLLVLNKFCRYSTLSGLISTNYFVGFYYSGNLKHEHLKRILQDIPREGFCELICHPGVDDPDSSYRHWNYQWEKELEALTHKNVKSFLAENNIELCTYKQMVES